MITQERLKELLHYDPNTGIFTRLKSLSPRAMRGSTAGTTQKGRIIICIDNKRYKAHRLVWFYVYGKWPTGPIDHRNGIDNDNRLGNLRDVSQTINNQNQRIAQKNNLSGFLGVTKFNKRWRASICIDNKMYHLGMFNSPELAHEAYLKKKQACHLGCTI